MNLDYAWMIGMRDYLVEQNTNNPPIVEHEGMVEPRPYGIVQVGRYLADPQQNFGVLTLHVGDVEDPKWWHERITSQRMEQSENVARSGNIPFGRFMEIGGGSQWMFRYSAEMRLYYTLTGYDQVAALAHATESIHWTVRLLNELRPRTLGVSKVNGYMPIYQVCDAFKPEERGGTDNWIWFCKLHMELYVHADKMTA